MSSKLTKQKRKALEEKTHREAHPETCFCTYEERIWGGTVVGQSTSIAIPYNDSNRLVTHDIRLCGSCGKEYLDAPGYA